MKISWEESANSDPQLIIPNVSNAIPLNALFALLDMLTIQLRPLAKLLVHPMKLQFQALANFVH